jgi:hypothetical protein
LLALHRAGRYVEGDLVQLVDTVGECRPRAEHRARYALMQEQFRAAFDALRPISHALNAG